MQQPIQPTVQQASGLKLALMEIIPPKLERVNFSSYPKQTPRVLIHKSKRMMHLGRVVPKLTLQQADQSQLVLGRSKRFLESEIVGRTNTNRMRQHLCAHRARRAT
jgi:hypothetical protein